MRRGRRESALRKQRRPPGRPRARRPRHPRHGTVRHHRRPVRPQAWPRSQAQAQRCRAGLFGRRPSAARVRQRTPLAAVRRPTAGPSVLVPADPLGLQPPAAPGRVLVAVALGDLAARAPSWWDELRLVDSTPVPCAASRETVHRSDLAGHAGYGYCKSHHRYFWGFRLYVLAAGDGLPIAWCLATPKLGEREVVAAMLDHERARLRPGLLILGDKGFAGRDFEGLVAGYGARLLRPDRSDEPHRHGSLGRWRQWIESTFNTLKDQLGLERHRGRTLAGVYVRVAQRLLALAAAIWWNWEIAAPDKRSLIAYDH